MNFTGSQIVRIVSLLGISLLGLGCGQVEYDGLRTVQGTVTLDGQPYPNALITFSPKSGGRPSKGLTDAEGRYELNYIRTTKGAETGEHSVKIMTMPPIHEGPGMPSMKMPKEVLPARYNQRSTLESVVEEGPNEIDFELDS
ncbi:MAG: carboxypeptidase-like regulatory domain-containing protein [Pirellulaceae bacterium]